VCDEIRLVGRQHVAEVAQIVVAAPFSERGVEAFVEVHGEGRPVAVQAEEDRPGVGEGGQVLAGQQHAPVRLPGDQAAVPPDRHEHAVGRFQRALQPGVVAAPVRRAVHEGAGEYVVS